MVRWCWRTMKLKSAAFSGLRLALDLPEGGLADVRVLRRVDDVAQFDEPAREVVVDRPLLDVDGVGRPPFEAVLAHDHRPLLAGLQVLRQQQDAVGEHVRVHVEHHLVAGPGLLVVHLPRARVERHRRLGQLADHLGVEVVAVPLARLLPRLERLGVGLLPELLAGRVRVAPELLRVRDELVELPLVAVRRSPRSWERPSGDLERAPAALASSTCQAPSTNAGTRLDSSPSVDDDRSHFNSASRHPPSRSMLLDRHAPAIGSSLPGAAPPRPGFDWTGPSHFGAMVSCR